MGKKRLLEEKKIELEKEEISYKELKRDRKFFWAILTGCVGIIGLCTILASNPAAPLYMGATLIPIIGGVINNTYIKSNHNRKVKTLNKEIDSLNETISREEYFKSKEKHTIIPTNTIYEDVIYVSNQVDKEKVKVKTK